MDAYQWFAALSIIAGATVWAAVPVVSAMRRRAQWREVRRCLGRRVAR